MGIDKIVILSDESAELLVIDCHIQFDIRVIIEQDAAILEVSR